MPLPPDTRPPAPLPDGLSPLTVWPDTETAAAEAVRRFTTPPPVTRRITEAEARTALPKFMPQHGVHRDVIGSEGRIASWSWGDDDWPLVVCMHGWGGRGAQWSALVTELLARQHRVVVIDAPAHGASDGDRASLPAFRNALLRVLDTTGAPHALVGHSLGGLAVLAAIGSRANAGHSPMPRAISIAAPSTVSRPLSRFLRRHEATDAVRDAIIAQLEQRWHFHWAELETPVLAEQAMRAGGAPLLVVHAEDDEQVLIVESEGLTADWPGAVRWLAPAGSGHSRILRDETVIQRIADFACATETVSA